MLSCKGDMDQHFVHIWEDDDTPVSWNGRVVSNQIKSAEYDVSYWHVDGDG